VTKHKKNLHSHATVNSNERDFESISTYFCRQRGNIWLRLEAENTKQFEY